ncbi:MAG: hypothetical protein H0X30_25500 [Anaerolineae bacterium]|nr:hypothetical protein [Anaerolineae bacterium]
MQGKLGLRTSKWIWLVLSSLLLGVGAVTVHAWQNDSSELVTGQPSFGNITAAGSTITYTYTLSDARAVTLQAIGEVVQPTIAIVQNGLAVANQPNDEGNKIVLLTALLDAGTYTIQVGSINNTVGSVIVVVQSAEPITTGQLPLASVVTGQVRADATSATYNFTALPEPAYLYFESLLPTGGATLHLKNMTSGSESIVDSADVGGARFRIPAGSTAYEIDMAFTGTDQPQTFTLCLTTVSASSCEAGSVPVSTTGDDTAPTPDASNPSACTIIPLNANGANIRRTADAASPVLIGLPTGEVAAVIGVSPAGNFFNVSYKNVSGWVAKIAVSSNGDCSGVPVVTPPLFVPTPTPTPIPPTKAPEPTGPCLITMADKAFVYTKPDDSKPENLFDQVQKNYQLSPIGRLKNNSWWLTSYGNSWIQTKLIGHEAKVSGNCNHLPVVSPP